MGSQFVDLDADGRTDYFAATFDGSPHVALGVEGGFAEPEHILDVRGKRVMLDQFWDYDAKEWKGLDGGHCTSAVVFDWDADGDFDLLLGDYNEGKLYLQKNAGALGKPEFTGVNEEVLAGGESFALHGGMTAPRLVDWDGDGLTDLVCGSFGQSYTSDPPGAVYLFRNVGKAGAPEFAAATALIRPTRTTGHEADRPNVGLYADPVDYDGDGHLDLIVGGYSIWMPEPLDLTDSMRSRLRELKAEIEAVGAEIRSKSQAILKAVADLEDEARLAKLRELRGADDYKALSSRRAALSEELETLEPTRQRKAGVWVYLRRSS